MTTPDEIERLSKNATAGPWSIGECGGSGVNFGYDIRELNWDEGITHRPSVELIVYLRNNCEQIAQALRERERLVEALQLLRPHVYAQSLQESEGWPDSLAIIDAALTPEQP